jgi:hypothetical protein
MRGLTIGLALLVVSFVGMAAALADGNALPDPKFSNAHFAPLAEKTTWLSYVIESPSTTKLDKKTNSVTMTGGKTFLHSSKFAVEPKAKYSYKLTVKGTGTVSIQTLWWTKDDAMAKPHRTFSVKKVVLKNGETKTITGTDTASANAAKAYIRIVVEKGTVTVSQPVVTKL